MLTGESTVARAGIDAIAVKPVEHDLSRAADLPVDALVVDYEGPERFPDRETLDRLAAGRDLHVTTPVRAEGFDPLGDDSELPLPDGVGRVIVAGHPAYLTEREAARAVAPRLRAARESAPNAWVGTEGVERLALAVGGTQYDLLSPTTAREVRALRAAGVDEAVAVYAPVVCTDDEDAVLDALGEYVSRRPPVARRLPEGAPRDGTATGGAREVLAAAARDYALVGDPQALGERTDALREAGVDRVVGYPARGLDSFR